MIDEFVITFTDLTVIEGEGRYDEISKIMSKDFAASKSWMLETKAVLESQFGIAVFSLHLYHDGKLFIAEFQPSMTGDIYYNPDLRYLSVWAQEKGWGLPEPLPDLVRENPPFWKHYCEVGLIKSDYIKEKYNINYE